jgi:predicted nucleic acid-binding protein
VSREIRYWDSACFLAYFRGEEERVTQCEAALKDAEAGKILIVTSALTIAEVLALRGEARLPPDPAMKKKVADFFKNEYISVQNVTRKVAELARDLVWDHDIKPKDAIHVASALAVEAPILETFDRQLLRRTGKVGRPPLTIREPLLPEAPELPFEGKHEKQDKPPGKKG